MPHTTTIVIGGGQAGLAMSHCLSERGIEHVVLERGRVGERWRAHGWDSLRLLTPNWMTRLPGLGETGEDPDSFRTVSAFVDLLERYAASSRVPLLTKTTVHRVEQSDHAFRVITSDGVWRAQSVVIATGYCDRPAVPAMSRQLSSSIEQIASMDYHNPAQLAEGGVLVVGASSTGVQLAEEIRRSGRPVTLAVGRHTRLPRRYRGQDILWWLDRLGVLTQDATSVHDIEISRDQPSLQLTGTLDHSSLDLAALGVRGVRLTGRVAHIDGHRVYLADDLVETTAAADFKLAGILRRIDEFIARSGADAPARGPFVASWPLAVNAPVRVDLRKQEIRTVIWATGYRRAYPWLRVPVLDGRGEIRHHGGVTPCDGLYVLGLNFQRRRNSSFIDGVGADARYIAEHLAGALAGTRIA